LRSGLSLRKYGFWAWSGKRRGLVSRFWLGGLVLWRPRIEDDGDGGWGWARRILRVLLCGAYANFGRRWVLRLWRIGVLGYLVRSMDSVLVGVGKRVGV
jgi:hypothetical protein